MSLKVLMDPVYSAGPKRCSSAFKCHQLVTHVLEVQGRSDVFFYWMVPTWMTDEDREWLPKHPNIRYIEFPYHKDRNREYLRYPDQLDTIQAFNGEFWDFDLVFTSRTSLIPFTRAVMNSPRQMKDGRMFKKIVCFEEMIIMGFRPSVAKSDLEAQEIMALTGYLASDLVFTQTEPEKREILKVASRYMSPSMVRKIDKKFYLATPMAFREVSVKEEQHRYTPNRQFCLSFTGRMESVSSNLDGVFKVMQTKFALSGDDVRLLICTVSSQDNAMHAPPSAADVRRAPREEFWRLAREEMDLMLVLHNSAPFSLSLMEPAMLGVPLILADKQWAHDIYGRDYPFYVKGVDQAYAMVKLFMSDYPKYYGQFLEWQQRVLKPMFAPGGYLGGDMFSKTYEVMQDHEFFLGGKAKQILASRKSIHTLVQTIIKNVPDGRDDFVLFDLIQKIAAKEGLTILGQKTRNGDRDTRRLVFSTPWNELRTVLKFYGWEDASTTVGHFRRVKEAAIKEGDA